MYSVKDFENFSIKKKIREYGRNYVEKKSILMPENLCWGQRWWNFSLVSRLSKNIIWPTKYILEFWMDWLWS